MKKAIIGIFLVCFITSKIYLVAQTVYSFSEDGDLLDERGRSLLIQLKYDGESELREKYPEVISLDGSDIQINYEVSFVFKKYPFVLWDVNFEFQLRHGDFPNTLTPRWIFFRRPVGNTIDFSSDYFGKIYRKPPKDFAVELFGKLQLNPKQSYDEILKLLKMGKIIYEIESDNGDGLRIFNDFSQTLLIKIAVKDDLIWFRLLFNSEDKLMSMTYFG